MSRRNQKLMERFDELCEDLGGYVVAEMERELLKPYDSGFLTRRLNAGWRDGKEHATAEIARWERVYFEALQLQAKLEEPLEGVLAVLSRFEDVRDRGSVGGEERRALLVEGLAELRKA